MSDSSYGSVYVEGVTYIDEREIAKRDAEIERLLQGERAADAEIERLRLSHLETENEIERLRDAAVIARTTEANLHSEIERLRDELSTFRQGKHHTENAELKAEIEQLRKELKASGKGAQRNAHINEMMAQKIADKNAEIERLREELNHCIHVDNHNAIVAKLNDQIEHMSVAIENSGFMQFAYKQEQEIERLRDDRDSWAQQASDRTKDCVEYIEEIERLRNLSKDRDVQLSKFVTESTITTLNLEIERLRQTIKTIIEINSQLQKENSKLKNLVLTFYSEKYMNEVLSK